MEQNLEIAGITGILKRRKWLLILPLIGVFSLSVVVALALPNVFRSSATIMIENPQVPQNLVQSTVTGFADQRIQGITQEVTSRTKILSLIEKHNLLPEKREKLTAEDLVEMIKKRISIETIDAEIKKESLNKPAVVTIAFKLSYEDDDPGKAQRVANEIASYYMEKNHEERAKHAQTTSRFLEEQRNAVKGRLDELEGKIAAFREAHLEELPEFTTLNMQKIEKMNGDISNLNMQIRSMEEQRATVRSRLAVTDPFAGGGERILSPQERMKQAQLERAALASKYSAKHPLVVAKDQEIELLGGSEGESSRTAQAREQLKQLEAELSELKGRYSDKHPSVRAKMNEIEGVKRELQSLQGKSPETSGSGSEKATSPAYIAMMADLEKTEASIGSMKAERTRLEEQMKILYEKLRTMPRVSKEYNEMTTDYENSKKQFAELQQKLVSAQLSQGMEEEQLGETFQVIEPAFLPEKPVKPNRLAIILIGVVLGMGLSVGVAALSEFTDSRIHDVRTLEQLIGMTILSAVPRIVTREEIQSKRRKRILLAAGVIGGAVVAVAAFHFFVMDLYILQAKIMRLLERKMII